MPLQLPASSCVAAARLAFREVNIWKNPAAAEAVRAVTSGNETVPTIESTGRWLVNPTADEVCAAAGHRRTEDGAWRGLDPPSSRDPGTR